MAEYDVVLEHVDKTFDGDVKAVIDFNAEIGTGSVRIQLDSGIAHFVERMPLPIAICEQADLDTLCDLPFDPEHIDRQIGKFRLIQLAESLVIALQIRLAKGFHPGVGTIGIT